MKTFQSCATVYFLSDYALNLELSDLCYSHKNAKLARIGWFLARLNIVLLIVVGLTLRAVATEYRDSEVWFHFLARGLSTDTSLTPLIELKLLQVFKKLLPTRQLLLLQVSVKTFLCSDSLLTLKTFLLLL